MPFGRRDINQEFIFRGRPVVGWSADLLLKTLRVAVDDLVVSRDGAGLLRNLAEYIPGPGGDARAVGAKVVGLVAGGSRAAAVLSGAELGAIGRDLEMAAKLHLPLAVVHTRDPLDASPALNDASFNSGFRLFAGNMQELLDFALITIRIAEKALIPGICTTDALRSAYDVSSLHEHERDLIEVFLGQATEEIASATNAQQMTLGERRRRVPTLLTKRRPVGLNPVVAPDEERLIRSAHAAFFNSDTESIIQTAFDDFGAFTGRFYDAIGAYRTQDADYLIVSLGEVGSGFRTVIDYLRKERRVRLGALRIRLVNPFPEAVLRQHAEDKTGIIVMDSGGSDDGPLSRMVRASLGSPFPPVHTFVNPSGAAPTVGDWLAVLESISSTSGTDRKTLFVLPKVDPGRSRIPGLERTDQLLRQSYPTPPWVHSSGVGADDLVTLPSLRLFAERSDLIGEAGGLLAQALSTTTSTPVVATLVPGRPNGYGLMLETGLRCVAVDDPALLQRDAILDSLAPRTAVIVPSTVEKIRFWSSLPDRFRQAAIEKELSVYSVPHFSPEGTEGAVEQCAVNSLLGAAVRALLDGHVAIQDLAEAFGELLAHAGVPTGLRTVLVEALTFGFRHTERMSHSDAPARTVGEPEPPWVLDRDIRRDETVFDPARFWTGIGFAASSGRTSLIAPDPYLGSRIVPAQTSVISARRTETPPEWIPENCTACGLCWTFCPHSALPVTVASIDRWIDTARAAVEGRGGATMQVSRLGKHLSKRVHKLIAADDLHRFTRLGEACAEALEQLLDAANLDDDSASEAREEFESVIAELSEIKLARTESFFVLPDKTARGSGKLVSITVDPDACTACGICAAVCPDEAITMDTAENVDTGALRHARNMVTSMSIDGEAITSATDNFPERALAHELVDPDVYYATLGGGRSAPGSGTRLALRLIAATGAALAKPRQERLSAQISGLEDELKTKMQALFSQSLTINDFDDFAQRLRALGSRPGRVDVGDLLNVDARDTIDSVRLHRLSESLLEIEALRTQLASESATAAGIVAVFGDAPVLLQGAEFPDNPFPFPWINAAGSDPVALAQGVFHALSRQFLATVSCLRKARMIVDDTYDRSTFVEATIASLDDEERELLPVVCLFVEHLDRSTLTHNDAGDPIRIFFLDQLRSTSDAGMSLQALSHPSWHVAQTVPAYPEHFFSTVSGALRSRSMSLTRIYVPEPERHEFEPHHTIERMKDAVTSRVFPLFRYLPDASLEWTERWSLEGNPDPRSDWTADDGVTHTPGEWFGVEGRFSGLFETLPKASWNDASHTPFAEFLALDKEKRTGAVPYVQIQDRTGATRRLRTKDELVRVTELIQTNWQLLQEVAGVRSALLKIARQEVAQELRVAFEAEHEAVRADTEARIDQIRAEYEAEFRDRLTSKLLALSGFQGTSKTMADWLSEMEQLGRGDEPAVPEPPDSGR